VYRWIEGQTQPVEAIDATKAARDLAGFVAALQLVDPAGAPSGRSVPLAERDEEFSHWLGRFDGPRAVRSLWERALAAPPWGGVRSGITATLTCATGSSARGGSAP
jgi:hypothetical protein